MLMLVAVLFFCWSGSVDNGGNSGWNFNVITPCSQFQKTYVPDDNFEAYLETHDASGNTVNIDDPTSMGDGIANNDSVLTANISGVTNLNVNNQNADLTGLKILIFTNFRM